jgi:hypothetical protein
MIWLAVRRRLGPAARLLDTTTTDAGSRNGPDANPLPSLFTRLAKDGPLIRPPVDDPPREIAIGAARLIVHPSFADFRASATVERNPRSA